MLVRRALLVLMIVIFPAAATWALYHLSIWILHATNRIVADPQMLSWLTVGEFLLFTFGAVLEARSRWSAPSSSSL
jgi:hypothetical protein